MRKNVACLQTYRTDVYRESYTVYREVLEGTVYGEVLEGTVYGEVLEGREDI